MNGGHQSKGQARTTIYLTAITLLLISHALFYSARLGWDAVDDAYVSFRYAQNAARGHGLAFNPGQPPVEGYTNFLWTILMIPAMWLRLPAAWYALALGLGCAVGGLCLASQAGRSLEGFAVSTGLLAALFLAADGSCALWAVGGLEGALFALLLLAGALSYLREMKDPAVWPLSGLWFALAAMTRPEGLFVFALTGLYQVLIHLFRERRLAAKQDRLRLALFLLIWGPWFIWRWRYYGYPLPNSFYAKVTLEDTAAQYQRGLKYVTTYLRIHLGWPILALSFLPLFFRHQRYWAGYFLLIVVAYTSYIAYVGGDWSVGRFFAPLMPLFYILLAAGLVDLAKLLGRWLTARRLPRPVWQGAAAVFCAALAAGFFAASSLQGELALFIKPFNAQLAGQARTALGRWLHDHMPANTVVAVDAAGQLPYYSELPTIDIFGINDAQIAHMRVQTMGRGPPGHEKLGIDEVVSRRPDYIIIYGRALDHLTTYRRVELPWSDRPEFRAFLSVYQRKE